eukprot:Phypoly_transcript_00360.p1 GENE.Phypoly_transcript_00360~~Phypoly_transcript_00360.p1  ORF type:complete len:1639 (+),score=219.92 Phypoly_transcript_00360:165-5081(+)
MGRGERDDESWFLTVFHQWMLLMKKNFILTKRRRFMAALQLLSPILFMSILSVVQMFVTQSFQTLPTAAKVTVSSPSPVPKIPHCFHPFNRPGAHCFTLAYAPSNNITDLLIQRVAQDNDLIYESDVMPFNTEDEMDNFILNNPNTTQAGYVFLQYSPGNFEYSIMFNETQICDSGVVQTCKDFVTSIALPMNVAMDREIIRYQQELSTGNSQLDYTWNTGQSPQPSQVVYNAAQWLAAIFLFAAIMFNFVILLRTMVLEKELRLKEGLKMMGLKEFSYWGSWFIYYNVVMLQCIALLIASGYIFSIDLITKNSFPVYFVLLMLFAESMIFFAFLLESLLSKSQSSATIAFVFWIVMCAAITPVNQLIFVDSTPVWVLKVISLLSPLSFSKGISDLAVAGAMGGIGWDDIHDFSSVFPLAQTYLFIGVDCVIYFVLAWYISNVFPGEYGVPKPWYFFVTPSYWKGSVAERTGERARLLAAQQSDESDAVVLNNLSKSFRIGGCKANSYHHAVKGVSLTMQRDQLFCMLGPNGAGKTTTISMLTGLFPASGGDAYIFGNSISKDMDKIRRVMGVCPQHDLLWDDMSAREHLEFFCRFKKNAGYDAVKHEVKERLEEVGLTGVADIPVSAFSGGEKRRLSVALALAGNPKIVFLDEPTTGMDPVSRHQVWEIIQNAKNGRVVILTTHSMEEADVLSDKIAIITQGELRSMGTSLALKSEHGIGYQLHVYVQDHTKSPAQIVAFCTRRIESATVAHSSKGSITFNIPKSSANFLPQLLRDLESTLDTLGISEITVNLSSLEDVFLKIAGEDVAAEDANLIVLKDNIEKSVMEVVQDGLLGHSEGSRVPFSKQFTAFFRKSLSSQKAKWSTLLMQFIIPVLIVAVMYASGLNSASYSPNNPHPSSNLPPLVNIYPPPQHAIPYISQVDGVDMGTCCNGTLAGFLGNVTLESVNSGFPADYFVFSPFPDKPELDQFLYENYKLNWVAAYFFTINPSIGLYNISLLHNTTNSDSTVALINIISNAILRYTSNNSSAILAARYKQFPTLRVAIHPPPMNIESTWCVIGLSFYMAIILSSIVFEKEHKQRYLMTMAGMRMSVYWVVLFILHLFIYLVLCLFFILLAFLFKIRYFTLNSPAIYIVGFFIFAFSQVGMAFFISTFCSSTHSASLGAYVFLVTMTLIQTYINPTWAQFGAPAATLYTTALIPQIAYGRLIAYVVNFFFPEGQGMTWHDMQQIIDLRNVYFFLFGEALFFFVVHQYFEHVIPSEFSVPLSPIFCLKKSYWCPSQPTALQRSGSQGSLRNVSIGEPADVAEERAKAAVAKELPVQVQGITKVFKGAAGVKVAVNNLAFTVSHGECFGLIGPNGGGKSTLINVLSGLYPTTSGKAFINGYSVTKDLLDVQRCIGVCPQDSILWDELTGRQHLLYFARLRGLSGENLDFAVDQLLYQVMLTDAQHRPAGGYSGGMKRRLSLAMSLIGNPLIVMLDEPTTGVDPYSKRVVWDVIQAYKKHCSIILTTHSMQEAETLCDRVCMLVAGSMKCIGRPIELKSRYSAGYSLTISHKGSRAHIQKFVKELIPDAQLADDLSETLIFSLPKVSVFQIGLGTIFDAFQSSKEKLSITDWGILQSSLADVLLKVVNNLQEKS